MTKTVALAMLFVFVVAALVGGGVAYWLKPSANVRVSVHVDQIRNSAHLATVEYRLSAFVDKEFTSNVGFGHQEVSDYVIAKCTGTVTGRVDLDKEKAAINVQEGAEGRQVSIHFKRGSVVISDVAIDLSKTNTFETISCREKLRLIGFLKPATSGQRDEMHRLAMQKIRDTAIETGIVEKTMENAKTVLGNFVGAFGYRVTVTFDEKAYDPEPKK